MRDFPWRGMTCMSTHPGQGTHSRPKWWLYQSPTWLTNECLWGLLIGTGMTPKQQHHLKAHPNTGDQCTGASLELPGQPVGSLMCLRLFLSAAQLPRISSPAIVSSSIVVRRGPHDSHKLKLSQMWRSLFTSRASFLKGGFQSWGIQCTAGQHSISSVHD